MDNTVKDIFTSEESLSKIRKRLKNKGFISLKDKMVDLVKNLKMNPEDYLRYYNFRD